MYILIFSMTSELVVAVCTENLDWIDEVSNKYNQVTVYDKCQRKPTFRSGNVSVQGTPNVGSCDNSFLRYIIDRYDSLPDRVTFTKGSTREDDQTMFTCRQCKPEDSRYLLEFKLTDWRFTHNTSQKFEFVQSPHKNMGEWIDEQQHLSRQAALKTLCNVRYGGKFTATRYQIQNSPVSAYKSLLQQQAHTNEEVDHYIERSWPMLFCRTP